MPPGSGNVHECNENNRLDTVFELKILNFDSDDPDEGDRGTRRGAIMVTEALRLSDDELQMQNLMGEIALSK